MDLQNLIGNKNTTRIILFFLEQPTLQIYQAELQQKLKLAKATMIKWLKLLTQQNILLLKQYGRTKVYYLNRENPIVKQIKILNNITKSKPITELAEQQKITAYLYGSCSRGEDTEQSDIDILLIGEIATEKIIREIREISEKIGKNVKIQAFTPKEWVQMAEKDPAFYERVEKDKIKLNLNEHSRLH